MPHDPYTSSNDPEHCAHPNQTGREFPQPEGSPKLVVTCDDCGSEWS